MNKHILLLFLHLLAISNSNNLSLITWFFPNYKPLQRAILSQESLLLCLKA